MNCKYLQQNIKSIYEQISKTWDSSIVPQLIEYIKIPNKSPAYDPNWQAHGHMHKAMQLIANWCEQQPIKNMKVTILQEEKRTPLLYIDIAGQCDETIMMYGHMDKQPEMAGWREGLGPWQPVLQDDKLYGRGSSDDGYSVFAALTAIAVLQQHQIPHGRCLLLIEACEESGSYDLPFYLDYLKKHIGKPSLVICLDSDAGNYQQMWLTTSLRGLIGGSLKIAVLEEGMHSGTASGVVPSTWMVLRQLLDRVENAKTGKVLLKAFQATIPKHCIAAAKQTARAYGKKFFDNYPFLSGVKPTTAKLHELLLNHTWRPQLSITGINGLPAIANAGNVTVPHLTVQLSFRIPPSVNAKNAAKMLKTVLEKNPPFKAKVTFTPDHCVRGCELPKPSAWLAKAVETASTNFFGKPAAYFGTGGCIPFIRMLGERYPQAQFVITGVLGPKSNAHGPNEFLHLPMAKKITGCVAAIVAAHYEQYCDGK
jgi:acetylornithine deacetylase/succinyl-diaminopimelate desuccinylase-like protein